VIGCFWVVIGCFGKRDLGSLEGLTLGFNMETPFAKSVEKG
jgi:hypothetical protein